MAPMGVPPMMVGMQQMGGMPMTTMTQPGMAGMGQPMYGQMRPGMQPQMMPGGMGAPRPPVTQHQTNDPFGAL